MTPQKSLKDQAVKFALENNWQQASVLNERILETFPDDIDTLNRLAFSYIKLGDLKKAKATYKHVTDLDKTNPIAIKNLKKIEIMSQQGDVRSQNGEDSSSSLMENVFIEEAGKTKTVDLKNIADQKSLSLLQPGDSVSLTIKRSKIFVQSTDKKYIGMLPEHLGVRLISFMQGGNEYKAFIKAITEKNVTVFIKEVKRATKFKNQPSFSLLLASHGKE